MVSQRNKKSRCVHPDPKGQISDYVVQKGDASRFLSVESRHGGLHISLRLSLTSIGTTSK